jgi:ABC-type transport system substrate-binding protein
MTNGAAAGGAATVAAEAVAQAIKASGAIVSVESTDFMTILGRVDFPLVVCSESKFLSTKYHYLTAYKGLIFYTKSSTPLMLRPSVELIHAKKIWIPG